MIVGLMGSRRTEKPARSRTRRALKWTTVLGLAAGAAVALGNRVMHRGEDIGH